jgi:hypothetical protein
LDDLRVQASRWGFTISAPPAAELPTTVWDDLAKGAGSVALGASDTWTFVKYAAWAALGLGTVIALSSVAQNLRTGRDPAERYVKLFRQRGRAVRAVARAALPPPVRFALPPGKPPSDRGEEYR